MNNVELIQLMSDSAKDAVNVSKEEFNINLDFSRDSIALVDLAINSYLDIYKTQALEDKAVFTICNIYGAYIGETYRKLVGGNWQIDNTKPQSPSIFLLINNNSYAFAGICYEKLVNNSLVSIQHYFEQAFNAHHSK